jgi:hypothetical protein
MSFYSPNHGRFDNARPLDEDQMRKIAPSIFATEPHTSRSDRFAPIPTIALLRGLQREGFEPVGVQQSKSRDVTKREFTKHLIRLRRLGDTHKVGDTVCEILLKNANDGSSCYDLLAGLFRIRCLNSLVAQTGTIDQVKIKHSGVVMPKVIEGTYRVLNEAHKALAAPETWSQIKLEPPQREVFAEAAHLVRFGDQGSAIKPTQLLHARRPDDLATDLWTTFNVIQENTIRGGLSGFNTQTRRASTTREIRGIDQSVALNKALWLLAERMAQLA